MHDRRRNVRARVPLIVTAFADEKRIGDYLVRNLSAGGALLFNGPLLPVNTKLRLLLQGALPRPFSLTGAVIRSCAPASTDSLVVSFGALSPADEDLLQDLVLRSLESEDDPAVLVLLRRPRLLALLSYELTELGHRAVLTMTEPDTTNYLVDVASSLAAIVVDVSADPFTAFQALELVEKRFPKALRIALCDEAHGRGMARALARARADAVLDLPWSREQLRSLLPPRASGALPKALPPDARGRSREERHFGGRQYVDCGASSNGLAWHTENDG